MGNGGATVDAGVAPHGDPFSLSCVSYRSDYLNDHECRDLPFRFALILDHAAVHNYLRLRRSFVKSTWPEACTAISNAWEGEEQRYYDFAMRHMGPNVRAHARARMMIDQGATLLARRGGARG